MMEISNNFDFMISFSQLLSIFFKKSKMSDLILVRFGSTVLRKSAFEGPEILPKIKSCVI